ncbi:MAG: low affinity iron permease family protein [Candidatus Melainabacteria bacterium]
MPHHEHSKPAPQKHSPPHRRGWFFRFARKTAQATGHPLAFATAVTIIVVWAVTGPVFHFSDTWQLVINTGTTIVTFLMVFLIQSTQNRDSEAIHLKLDELIRAVKGAHNELIDIEEGQEEDLEALRHQFSQIAESEKRRHRPPAD